MQQKLEALLNYDSTTGRKQFQSFLALVGYYRKCLLHLSTLTAGLSEILKKNVKWDGTPTREQSFLDIKSRPASKPVLVPPDYEKPFILAVDASDTAIEASLMQESDGCEHPICFFSKKLITHQRRHATIEKEALALLTAVRHFSVYFGSHPVKFYTDRSPLTFLDRMVNQNQKLLRWRLELQQYKLEIMHRPRKENLFPELLNRPC